MTLTTSWSAAAKEVERLINHSMTRSETEAYVSKTDKICEYLKENIGKTAFALLKVKPSPMVAKEENNYGSTNGKYLNPGGYLKDNKLLEEAVVGEVLEETGVKIAPVGMIAIRCQNNEWYMVLKADYIEGEPCSDLSENDEAIFINISEALSHPYVTDTAKTLIRSALENKTIPAAGLRKNRVIYSVK